MPASLPPSPTAGRPLSPLRFVLGYLRQYRAALLAAIVWSFAFVLIPMQVPFLTGALVNGITGQGGVFLGLYTVHAPGEVVVLAVLGLVLAAVGIGVTAYLSTAATAELSRTSVAGLRKDLIRKLDRASMDVHGRFGSGELLSRIIVDTQSIRDFIETVFFNSLQSTIRVAYPVAMLALLDPMIGLVAAAILPVQWVLTREFQMRLRAATRVARTTQGRLTARVKENLDGIESIQTSAAEETAIAGLSREADRLAADQVGARTYTGLISGSTWGLAGLGLALTWWLGGEQVLAGQLTLGGLVVVTGFVALLYVPMQRFTSIANVYQKGVVALERVQEVLSSPSGVTDLPGAPPLAVGPGRIEVRGVTFGYGSRAALRGVSIEFEAGRVTAIVGRNGSGKSTLLKLLDRLADPQEGAVLIDGQDLRSVRLDSLRGQVAFVPQSPAIFAGTIRENVRLGAPAASEAEVVEACHRAGALEFIVRMRSGLDTLVGAGGTGLSGGEVQRIAIARALVRRPRILLLDEPNSALDGEAEGALAGVLRSLRGRVTVVLVGHHLEGLSGVVDRIVHMDGGRVVGPGREPSTGPLPHFAIAASAGLEGAPA